MSARARREKEREKETTDVGRGARKDGQGQAKYFTGRAAEAQAQDHPGKKNNVILVSGHDSILFFTIVTLVIFGVIMIFSSSYYKAANSADFGNNMYYFLVKQGLAVGLGFVGMLVISGINYHVLGKWLIFGLYLVANGLLVYVRLFGKRINGAWRWIEIPVFGSFQPSEFAKIVVIIAIAWYIARDAKRAATLKGMAFCGAIALIPCALVFWGNNLSTAMIIGIIAFVMVFASSPYFFRFIAAGAGAVSLLVGYLAFGGGFRSDRFAIWKNPFLDPTDKGFQTVQSLFAVASGGLFGLGLGQSHQKLIFMPEPYNDFIFAIICEELGFFGAAALLGLFVILIWRGIVVALNACDLFGTLIALGTVVLIASQVIINVGVVTNTIPNTGIPLPFISYGGTSVLFIMCMMGVLLNISRYSKKAG